MSRFGSADNLAGQGQREEASRKAAEAANSYAARMESLGIGVVGAPRGGGASMRGSSSLAGSRTSVSGGNAPPGRRSSGLQARPSNQTIAPTSMQPSQTTVEDFDGTTPGSGASASPLSVIVRGPSSGMSAAGTSTSASEPPQSPADRNSGPSPRAALITVTPLSLPLLPDSEEEIQRIDSLLLPAGNPTASVMAEARAGSLSPSYNRKRSHLFVDAALLLSPPGSAPPGSTPAFETLVTTFSDEGTAPRTSTSPQESHEAHSLQPVSAADGWRGGR